MLATGQKDHDQIIWPSFSDVHMSTRGALEGAPRGLPKGPQRSLLKEPLKELLKEPLREPQREACPHVRYGVPRRTPSYVYTGSDTFHGLQVGFKVY